MLFAKKKRHFCRHANLKLERKKTLLPPSSVDTAKKMHFFFENLLEVFFQRLFDTEKEER